MALVGLAGDWHGNGRWAVSVIEFFAGKDIKTIYQLGDFGIWPGPDGKAYLDEVIEACKSNGVTLWITPGNHEDWTQIEDENWTDRQVLAGGEEDGWEVALLPRGYTWELDGRSFISLGGAPSIDFQWRSEGKSWWPEEAIREEHLDRLVQADVMLAHDAPDGSTQQVQDIISDNPMGWSETGLNYCAEGRELMNRAVEIVQPKLFAHGHYHVFGYRKDKETGQVWLALSPDGVGGSIAILDTENLNVSA